MGSQDQRSIIQRKAQTMRDGFESREMSPPKALRLALTRDADRLFGLALTVATVEQVRLTSEDLAGTIPDEGLFLLLEGDGGARGMMRIDPAFLSALIEVQTIGRLIAAPAPLRRPTPTDAAMVAPLVDAVLADMDRQMSEADTDYIRRGFGFGDIVEDLRTLSLLLMEPGFDLIRLTADIGPGVKTGRLDLLLPRVPARARPEPPGTAEEENTPEALGTVIRNAPLVLEAVLARFSLPLRELCALQPGTVLSIPDGAIGDSCLSGPGGHVVARGRLGQVNGWRALRLVSSGSMSLPLPEPEPDTETSGPAPLTESPDPQPRWSAAPPAAPETDPEILPASASSQAREPV